MAGRVRQLTRTGASGYTTNELLLAAIERGGAVADVAKETINPRENILSTIGDGFKNAFSNFVEVLDTPNQIVAGAISKDYTISEALEQNINISDVVLGQEQEYDSRLKNFGDATRRFAVDVLLDPTTYIGSGAVKGVFGVVGLTKIKAGKNLAKTMKLVTDTEELALHFKNKTLKEFGEIISDEEAKKLAKNAIDTGDIPDSFLDANKKLALSVEGENKLNQFYKMKLDAQRQGIRALSANLLKESLKDKAANELKNIIREKGIQEGKKFSESYINKLVVKLEKNADNAMIDQFLNSRLLRDEAEKAMANLISAKPALIETFLDKGGIKFMGKTILSSKRIMSSVKLIPGLTLLDNATQPLRKLAQKAFDPNKIGLPEEAALGIISKWNNYATGEKQIIKQKHINILKNLKITDEEYNIIRQAIENRKEPVDQRLKETWQFLQGIKPDGRFINSDMIRAEGFFRREFTKNMKTLRLSGQSTTSLDQYYPHMMVKEPTKWSNIASKKVLPASTKERKYNVFVDQQGNEFIAVRGQGTKNGLETIKLKGFNGEEIKDINVKNYSRKKEEMLIMDRLAKSEKIAEGSIKRIRSQAQDVINKINKRFYNKTTDEVFNQIEKVLGKTISGKAKLSIKKMIQKTIPRLEISSMIADRLRESYKEGVKIIPKLDGLSKDDLIKIKNDLNRQSGIAEKDLKLFQMALEEVTPKSKSKVVKEGISDDDSLRKIAETIKNETKESLQNKAENLIDETQLSELLRGFAKAYQSDPKGSKALLDKLIGAKQAVDDIVSELELEKLGTKEDLAKLVNDGKQMFIDENKEIWKRMEVTVEEGRKLGINWDPDIYKVAMVQSLKNTQFAFDTYALKELAEKFGTNKATAPHNFREINLPRVSGEQTSLSNFITGKDGNSLVFHPRVATAIENAYQKINSFDEGIEGIGAAIDSINGIVKASVTTIFPGFHALNAFGNVFLNFLDIGLQAINPLNHVSVVHMMGKSFKADNLQKLIDIGSTAIKGSKEYEDGLKAADELADLMTSTFYTDRHGYNWSFGELKSVISRNAIAFNPNHVGQLDISNSDAKDVKEMTEDLFPESSLKAKAGKVYRKASPLSQEFIPYKLTRRYISNPIEEQARLMNFLTNLYDTGDVEFAAQRTKQFLFDYQNITEFERNVMRRIIPFYTFARKNLELQAKALVQTPGRAVAQIRLAEGLGDIMSDGQLSEEEKKLLPSWLSNGYAVKVGQKGTETAVIGSFRTPFEAAVFQLMPQNMLSSITPLIKIPAELSSGTNFYRGKPISEVTNADVFRFAPDSVKDFIGFTEVEGERSDGTNYKYYVSLRPERMHLLLNLPPTSRVLSTLSNLTNQNTEASVKTLQSLTGFKIDSVDLEVEAKRREDELRKKLESILDDANVGYRFTRFVLPKD